MLQMAMMAGNPQMMQIPGVPGMLGFPNPAMAGMSMGQPSSSIPILLHMTAKVSEPSKAQNEQISACEQKILDLKSEWKQRQTRLIMFMKSQERFHTIEKQLLNDQACKAKGRSDANRPFTETEAQLVKQLGEVRVRLKAEIDGMQRERSALESQVGLEEKKLEKVRESVGLVLVVLEAVVVALVALVSRVVLRVFPLALWPLKPLVPLLALVVVLFLGVDLVLGVEVPIPLSGSDHLHYTY